MAGTVAGWRGAMGEQPLGSPDPSPIPPPDTPPTLLGPSPGPESDPPHLSVIPGSAHPCPSGAQARLDVRPASGGVGLKPEERDLLLSSGS